MLKRQIIGMSFKTRNQFTFIYSLLEGSLVFWFLGLEISRLLSSFAHSLHKMDVLMKSSHPAFPRSGLFLGFLRLL